MTLRMTKFYSGLLDVARGSEGVGVIGGSKCEVTKLILAKSAKSVS